MSDDNTPCVVWSAAGYSPVMTKKSAMKEAMRVAENGQGSKVFELRELTRFGGREKRTKDKSVNHILPDNLDAAIHLYRAERDREEKEARDHRDDPENMPVGGLAGRMFFEGFLRWGQDWKDRAYEIQYEGV